jgi:hypothetical protein
VTTKDAYRARQPGEPRPRFRAVRLRNDLIPPGAAAAAAAACPPPTADPRSGFHWQRLRLLLGARPANSHRQATIAAAGRLFGGRTDSQDRVDHRAGHPYPPRVNKPLNRLAVADAGASRVARLAPSCVRTGASGAWSSASIASRLPHASFRHGRPKRSAIQAGTCRSARKLRDDWH